MNKNNAIITFPQASAGFSSDYLTVASSIVYCLDRGTRPYVDTSNTWFNPTYDFEQKRSTDLSINPWNWWFDQTELDPTKINLEIGYSRDLIGHNPKLFMKQPNILLYAEVIDSYVKVKQPILDKIENYYNENLKGKNVLGIVARGTENLTYHPEYSKVYANQWPDKIAEYLDAFPEIDTLFLGICDDNEILDSILTRYPNTIYIKDMFRKTIQTQEDVLGNPNKMWWVTPLEGTVYDHRKRLGEEALMATKLIAKCDHFLGACSGLSNISQFFNKGQFVNATVI